MGKSQWQEFMDPTILPPLPPEARETIEPTGKRGRPQETTLSPASQKTAELVLPSLRPSNVQGNANSPPPTEHAEELKSGFAATAKHALSGVIKEIKSFFTPIDAALKDSNTDWSQTGLDKNQKLRSAVNKMIKAHKDWSQEGLAANPKLRSVIHKMIDANQGLAHAKQFYESKTLFAALNKYADIFRTPEATHFIQASYQAIQISDPTKFRKALKNIIEKHLLPAETDDMGMPIDAKNKEPVNVPGGQASKDVEALIAYSKTGAFINMVKSEVSLGESGMQKAKSCLEDCTDIVFTTTSFFREISSAFKRNNPP